MLNALVSFKTTTKQNVGIVLVTALCVSMAITMHGVERVVAQQQLQIQQQLQEQQQKMQDNPSTSSFSSYLNSARQFMNSGMQASNQAKSFSALMANEDPNTTKMLQGAIDKATDLINNYRQNGLSNLPQLPNLPGINTMMRLPDKLLRAELSMLQDEIRMAQDMMQNPVSATLNAPRDLASMMARMAQQIEQ